jgi:cytochrome c peroxidase
MRIFLITCGCLGLIAASRLMRPPSFPVAVQAAMTYFRAESAEFAASCMSLKAAVDQLGRSTAGRSGPVNRQAITAARQRLLECRLHYKRIESFLEYFFRSSSTIYNRPPKYEAEEGSMEYQSPIGMQVIEAMLYEPRPNQKALMQQADAIASAAADLPALLYDLKADDRQLLESLRMELIRVMALDITGYEAPLLKSGIRESYEALVSLSRQLQPYLQDADPQSDSVKKYLNGAIGMVRDSVDFDAFDRLTFLRDAALPLQKHLGMLIRQRGLELNTSKCLNYAADNLFSPDALWPIGSRDGGGAQGARSDRDTFRSRDGGEAADAQVDHTLILLGKALFSETALSANGRKSCASCHDPNKAFTDRRKVSVGLDGHELLDRNAPTLLYSGLQYRLFWDGRARSLEEQARMVLADAREMNTDTSGLLRRLRRRPWYDSCFNAAFPKGGADIAIAIAAYLRTLHPLNSPFDHYIRGESAGLNAAQRKGANLFLGKAQCATCHFMPMFNGLIPPDYALTEFEVLGTTSTDRLAQPPLHLDKDPGRYKLYPFPFYKGAFKTPTVRDAALTYPYMHNGAFRNLETLMDFYDKGGGAGLGLNAPEQTLSSSPLHLSAEEKKDIILFIHTLTDNLQTYP